jgi:predicted Zn finger-like uncharacterized protein
MLITTCTHCLARFRVVPQQLNARQGQVRCGRCRKVFNGFEALERYPDDDTGSRLLAAREAELRAETPPPLEPHLAQDAAEAAAGLAPDIPAAAASASATTPSDAAAFAVPPTTRPGPVAGDETPSRPLEPRARKPMPMPAYGAAFESSRRKARGWTAGATFLALVFAAQIVYALRGPIAQRYPVFRAPLESVCAFIGCGVPWAHDEALLKLEDSELLEVPGRANQIALTARIRNLSRATQEFPHLELTLTDVSGLAAARRILRPVDYLGRPVAQGEALASGAELALQLRLETPHIKATGYELLLFYP